MKKFTLFTICMLLLTATVVAQTPQAFNYQAVARDVSGNVLANQSVRFKISILQGSASGTVVFSESHLKTTSQFGLATLEIGRGTLISGSFSTISWGTSTYYVKTELDPAGGTAYFLMGTSQLLSVPYAIYAKTAETGGNILPSGTSGQTLRHNGTAWINTSNLFNNGTNIGIGTTAPTYKFELSGADASLNGLRIGKGNGNIGTNTALGFEALNLNTTGDYNTAAGYRVLLNNTIGTLNTSIGYSALYNLAKGTGNTALGFKALYFDSVGNNNSAGGTYSLYFNKTGLNNSVFGAYAGYGASENSYSYNSLFGSYAGYGLTTGSRNILLGYRAGDNLTTGSYNIILGYNIDAPSAAGDNQLVLGASDLFYGDLVNKRIGIGTTAPEGQFHVNSDGDALVIVDADANDAGGEDQNPRIELRQDAKKVVGALGYTGSDGSLYTNSIANSLYLMNEFDSPIHFGADSSIRVTLSSTGFLGIGTTNPLGKLSVQKSSGFPPVNDGDKGLVIKDGTLNSASDIEIQDENGNPYFDINGPTLTYSRTGDVKVIFEADADNNGSTENYNPRLEMVQDGGAITGALGYTGETGSIYTGSVANAIYLMNESSSAIHFGTSNAIKMTLSSSGNLGIGTTTPASKLDVKGNVTIRDESSGAIAVELGTGLDYAEGFNVSEKEGIASGTVLCIDPDHPGNLMISGKEYDTRVAGIVAGANNLKSGISLGGGTHDFNVALAGRVYCNVDATATSIEVGDLLTTSSKPGFAMKVTDQHKAGGSILGKAMERMEKGKKGQVLVLVTLQ